MFLHSLDFSSFFFISKDGVRVKGCVKMSLYYQNVVKSKKIKLRNDCGNYHLYKKWHSIFLQTPPQKH